MGFVGNEDTLDQSGSDHDRIINFNSLHSSSLMSLQKVEKMEKKNRRRAIRSLGRRGRIETSDSTDYKEKTRAIVKQPRPNPESSSRKKKKRRKNRGGDCSFRKREKKAGKIPVKLTKQFLLH